MTTTKTGDSISRRHHPRARRALANAACVLLAACGSLVQVVDKDGAPVAGAQVAPAWAFYGEWETTDDDGCARIDDRWVGLGHTLQPAELAVRTAAGEFHIPYPLPSPVVLPVAVPPPAAPPAENR